jgi:hypothetical protein
MSKRLIDFFIVGVQKGGTTALDRFLRKHSQVQMAKVKEIHFFDDDSLNWERPNYTRLHEAFDWNSPDFVMRGEATPIYSYWPNSIQRLRTYNCNAKLILSLRHPSFRAYSHWRMEVSRGAETLPFSAAIKSAGRQRVSQSTNGVHRAYSYVERGFYAAQIERLFNCFDPQQITFLRTDHLWNCGQTVIDGIQDFLGVSRQINLQREYVAPLAVEKLAAITPDDLAFLNALFTDDIVHTAKLTHLLLDDWLNPRYVEPIIRV